MTPTFSARPSDSAALVETSPTPASAQVVEPPAALSLNDSGAHCRTRSAAPVRFPCRPARDHPPVDGFSPGTATGDLPPAPSTSAAGCHAWRYLHVYLPACLPADGISSTANTMPAKQVACHNHW